MKPFVTFFYRLYQLVICVPVLSVLTLLTATVTILGCTVGNARFWGYWPAMMWSRAMCRVPLLRVSVSGLEKLDPHQSYVFVSNHQGPYDIFLIYGYIGRPFRWLMKKELARIPLVGKACLKAGHILVDKSGPKAIARTQQQAQQALQGGASIVVFPEGSRTFTGHMGLFRRGPFMLGHNLQLPIVPLTINGSFQVLPRQRGFWFVNRYRLSLTVHDPIPFREDLDGIVDESYRVVESSLPDELKGYMVNPDQ